MARRCTWGGQEEEREKGKQRNYDTKCELTELLISIRETFPRVISNKDKTG